MSDSTVASAPDDQTVNPGRRKFLVAATSAMGAVGAVAVATPFVGSWNPSAKAKAAGAPVRVDVSKVRAGEQIRAEWRGKPVFVLRRTDANLASLDALDERVADPQSANDQQPSYVDSKTRSIKPEIFITVGICTHLGCSPQFRPEVGPADLGADWQGGYFCPCHGSKFDLAGRVYKSVPAPLNLVVPPHRYETDSIVVIGEDEGVA